MLLPENRVVMISGANRGIGLAIANQLSDAGYSLSLGCRDPASIDETQFTRPTSIHHYDAGNVDTSITWTRSTLETFGRIDSVVLNAGVMLPAGLMDGTEEDLDLMWDINFKGPLRLIRSTLDALKRSGNGRVITIVSLSGKRLMGSGNLGYSASKFAALSLTHAVRHEGWDDGIRATAICPGLVDTDMVSHVEAPSGEFKITPESIAATTAYALSLPNSAAVAEILVNSRLEATF